ncbi:protein phosphatase 1K, mitochondrial [Orcinus orca]|uniref:Protein phosphatase Mn(2+)-dependent 1K n=2 Tax=Odontoceti TaxID=9722 RepID=A0A2U3V4F6_TURTR|nr:protein phosphatase 1K, mitochondrial [Orcinus orca]XP_004320244.1 protein phosphatase 1K, mitochondrial [Tursiops truncatus]XP_026972705.1 protein phosphatase 1K, mitochondrial [Lagenorhynchus obliquidens]XP_026972706.1 protein phosphatase 1K, mitochondrial [Lagenorhynchus obliquidens]XP_030721559.1 protein phosphatase 1K, mitochondrial [Globicephala melas]XP_030721560.1 protein phosphatase 1K, mitochondrial [Globicephala melas]XP_033713293.1 protein phosphatase 1K, mitochondrial [Tursiop
MSTAALLTLVRSAGNQVRRKALLGARLLQDDRWVTPTCHSSTSEARCSRFDPDGSGRPATWDNFGIWDNRIDEPILLPPSIKYGKPIPKVSLANVGCASQIGKRKENEDRFGFAQLTDEVLYFAVYDGHGGPSAADFCHTHMEKCILDLLPKEENLETVLTLAFLEIDKAFARHAHLSADATLLTSGTTATVALLRDGIELVVASVGDSRAILCRKGKPMKLTIDHTPERKDEKERIKKCGGFIAWNSLGQPHVNGRLAMTRSLGDLDLKTSGVIAEPETKRIKLHHADDSFLVLTTDGINFMVNSQEICDFVNQCHDPSEAAHAVTEQAIQYGTEDNTTAVVVPFGAWGKYKTSEINFSFSRSFASSGRWA